MVKTCLTKNKKTVKNNRNIILHYLWGLGCIAAATVIMCCCKGKSNCNMSEYDSIRIKKLAALDDSINKMSPSAERMLENGIRNAKDSIEWCEYAVRIGKLYMKKNNSDSMMLYLDKVKKTLNKLPSNGRTNNILGNAYEYEAGWKQLLQSDMKGVIKLHKMAFSKIMDSENKNSLSDIAANIGDSYFLDNNLPQAASYYRRALFLVDSLQLPKEKNITLYMGLARIYESLGDQSEAKRYYQQSEQYMNLMQQNMQVFFLNSFGSYYYKNKQYKKSLEYFKRLEALVKSTEKEEGFNTALYRINIADVYLNLGNISKAEMYLNLAEPYFKKNNIDVGIHYGNSIRIGILLKKKEYAEIEHILKNERQYTNIEYAIQKIRNNYLRQYYVATGNALAALQNKIAEDQKEDSITKSNSYMRASEIIQRFSEDTLSLHHDIAMAEKEQKAAEARTVIGGLLLVLIIVILFTIVLTLQVRKKQIAGKMERFMLRLENTRNRISPHFIFNILNNRIYTAGQKEKDELMALAQLIRKSLDISRDTFIPLKDELDFVKKYVEVQSYILRPDFSFTLKVPDNIEGIYIPSMSIQILAENSIKHGLKGLDRLQKLSINVDRNNDETTISVEDNGRGFDSTKGSGNGLGMSIIRQTMAAVNKRGKRTKMDMDIKNVHDNNGKVAGCRITLTIKGKIDRRKL